MVKKCIILNLYLKNISFVFGRISFIITIVHLSNELTTRLVRELPRIKNQVSQPKGRKEVGK